MALPPNDVVELLHLHGQEHLLHGWDRLSTTERDVLLKQITRVDFSSLSTLYKNRDAPAASLPPRSQIAPIPVLSGSPSSEVKKIGEKALSQGQAAVLLVAGGQGSRLGFEKPKGMYEIGPVSNASL